MRYSKALRARGSPRDLRARAAWAGTVLGDATLNTVGWIHGELEDPLGAMDWNRRGIAAAIEADFPDPEVENNARLNFADNLMALGRLDEAEEQLQRVEAVVRDPTPAQRLDLWRYSQHLFHTYGALWLVRGDTAKTLKLTERCLELAEPGRSPRYVSKARCLRAQVFLRSGKLAESEAELKIALENARLLGNPPQLWRTLVVLGDLQSAQDQTDPREKRGWKRSPSSRGWLPTSRTPRWQTHCCDRRMLARSGPQQARGSRGDAKFRRLPGLGGTDPVDSKRRKRDVAVSKMSHDRGRFASTRVNSRRKLGVDKCRDQTLTPEVARHHQLAKTSRNVSIRLHALRDNEPCGKQVVYEMQHRRTRAEVRGPEGSRPWFDRWLQWTTRRTTRLSAAVT